MPSSYKRISRRALKLLSSGENKFVDYKEKVQGLHAEDLVAFANSDSGGAILIGVREKITPNGDHIGEPIGHPIDDVTRLQILSKALSCSPTVQIEIVSENLRTKPFYRIEIPSGGHKPYSTNSGTYKIREDGRNSPLHPEALLKMFLDREGEEFRSRFAEAASKLDERMNAALTSVGTLEQAISSKIEEIGYSLGSAEGKADDAADTISSVENKVASLLRETFSQTQRLRAMVKKLGAIDPIKEKAESNLRKAILQKLKESPEFLSAYQNGERISISIEGNDASELDEEDFDRLVKDVVKELYQKAASSE